MNVFIKKEVAVIPKIIENISELLIAEARKQVAEKGYSMVTIRSIASACGIGVGTVYNYFPSKDMLVASFMLEDWQNCLKRMKERIGGEHSARAVLFSVYEGLSEFTEGYAPLFADALAKDAFRENGGGRHALLRSQIAEITALCLKREADQNGFLSEFLAENLLTWTMEGRDFETIFKILDRAVSSDSGPV